MAIDSLQSTDVPLTVTEAAASLRAGDVTSVELTSAMLARADVLDSETGTYVARFDDYAMARAAQADEDFAQGVDKGPYQGIPIGIKDILAMAEGPTTANSLILDREWGAGKDGPVVARLKAAGAVITGKLTTSEFAIGSPDSSKPFAIPKNPWNLDRSPGGSSAGTGNGIASGLIMAGIGTDTGGSIRIPAAWNGVTGLMPTFGRVPKSGCVPLGYSLDHIGPLARSARDSAAMLAIIAGYHPSDESCVDRPVDDYVGALTGDLTGLRIGIELTNHFPEGSDPALRGCFDAAIAVLADRGADIVEVTLPLYNEVTTALWVMMAAEALAYHHNDLTTRWADYYALSRANICRGASRQGPTTCRPPGFVGWPRRNWQKRSRSSTSSPHRHRPWVRSRTTRCSSGDWATSSRWCSPGTGMQWATRHWRCPWASPRTGFPCRCSSGRGPSKRRQH